MIPHLHIWKYSGGYLNKHRICFICKQEEDRLIKSDFGLGGNNPFYWKKVTS
jgi:hypothetical protein